MYGSNHEKIKLGSRARNMFWSRRGKTASKMLAESGGTRWGANYFKGRKRKTFRDWQ